jgi:hypothetical protein
MVKIMEIKQPRAGKEGKTYWHKVGVKFVYDDGKESIKLDSLPLPNEKGEVWMNLFEPRSRDDAGANGTWDKPEDTPTDTASKDFEDEIPF